MCDSRKHQSIRILAHLVQPERLFEVSGSEQESPLDR